MQLFLDMDGVLMDFDRAIADHGIRNDGYYHTAPALWTPEQRQRHESIIKLLNEPHFWPSVQPMRDAHLLWDWCRPIGPHVLTAVLQEATDPNWVARCKQESILRCFDPAYPLHARFHICLRPEKIHFARGNVLVDDNPISCAEWNEHGGTAVHHKDAFTTVRVLRELFGE